MPQGTQKHATFETILSALEALVYGLPADMALCQRLPHFYNIFNINKAELAAAVDGLKGVSRETLRRWESREDDPDKGGRSKLALAAKQALINNKAGADLAELAARWLSRGDPPKKKAPVAARGTQETTEAVASEVSPNLTQTPSADSQEQSREAQPMELESLPPAPKAAEPRPLVSDDPSSWLLKSDRLGRLVARFDESAKPPNWPLQEHVAWTCFHLDREALRRASPNLYFQRLARHCQDRPEDEIARKALYAYLLWLGPLVAPDESLELAKDGRFPAFQNLLEAQAKPTDLERYIVRMLGREDAMRKLASGRGTVDRYVRIAARETAEKVEK